MSMPPRSVAFAEPLKLVEVSKTTTAVLHIDNSETKEHSNPGSPPNPIHQQERLLEEMPVPQHSLYDIVVGTSK